MSLPLVDALVECLPAMFTRLREPCLCIFHADLLAVFNAMPHFPLHLPRVLQSYLVRGGRLEPVSAWLWSLVDACKL